LLRTAGSRTPAAAPERPAAEISVEVVSVGAGHPPGPPHPALLKIDVESREPDVLRGGRGLMRRARPLVVLELLPHLDAGPLESLRADLGYVDVRLRPDTAVVGGPVRPDPDSWNHLWSPPEHLDA